MKTDVVQRSKWCVAWCSSVSVVCFAAACSGSGDGDESVSRTEVVEVGLLLPYTGQIAQNAVDVEIASQLALVDINDGGGVLGGRRMAFVDRDTQGVPEVGAEMAEELIDSGIRIIQGEFSSSVTAALLEVTVPAGALLISGVSQSPALTATDNDGLFYRTSPTVRAAAELLAETIRDAGHSRVGLVQLLHPFSTGLASSFTEAFQSLECEAGDCEVVVDYQYAYGDDEDKASYDFDSGIQEALAANPDVLFFTGFPEDGLGYIQAALAAGYDETLYISTAIAGGSVHLELPENVWDRIFWADAGPQLGEGAEYWEQLWEEHAGSQVEVTPSALSSYDATMLLGLAITEAGSVEPREVSQALRNISNPPGTVVYAGEYEKALRLIEDGEDIEYQGASGTVDFDEVGDVSQTPALYALEDGRIVVVQ